MQRNRATRPDAFGGSAGQGASEYLIILAVVLLLAVVVVTMLTLTQEDTAGGSVETASAAYWRAIAKPLRITEAGMSEYGILAIRVQNSKTEYVTLDSIALDGQAASMDPDPVRLQPGGSALVKVFVPTGCTGTSYKEYALQFNYSTSELPGQVQVGEKKLVVKCQGDIMCTDNKGSTFTCPDVCCCSGCAGASCGQCDKVCTDCADVV